MKHRPSLPPLRAAIVSLLVAGGAEIGAENQEGETPQMYAEYRNHENVAKLLRDAADQTQGKAEGGAVNTHRFSIHYIPISVHVWIDSHTLDISYDIFQGLIQELVLDIHCTVYAPWFSCSSWTAVSCR